MDFNVRVHAVVYLFIYDAASSSDCTASRIMNWKAFEMTGTCSDMRYFSGIA